MSVGVLTWVFKHSTATGSDRLVLLAIADNADDDDWSCWPSVATIAAKARVSEATAHRSIRTLQRLGELNVDINAGGHPNSTIDRRYRPNRYTITPPPTAKATENQGSQSDTSHVVVRGLNPGVSEVSPEPTRGLNPGVSEVSPVTPESSMEPSVEPPEERDVKTSRSSSSIASWAPSDDDEDRVTITFDVGAEPDDGLQALHHVAGIVAHRRLTRRIREKGPVGNPDAWLRTATDNVISDLAEQFWTHYLRCPERPAAELADLLEPWARDRTASEARCVG